MLAVLWSVPRQAETGKAALQWSAAAFESVVCDASCSGHADGNRPVGKRWRRHLRVQLLSTHQQLRLKLQ